MLTLCSSREAFERIQLLPLKEEARRSEARAVLHLYALRTFESHRDVLEYTTAQRPGARRLAAIEVGFDTFTCFDRHAHKLLYRLLPREGPGDSLAAPLATDAARPVCHNTLSHTSPRKRQRRVRGRRPAPVQHRSFDPAWRHKHSLAASLTFSRTHTPLCTLVWSPPPATRKPVQSRNSHPRLTHTLLSAGTAGKGETQQPAASKREILRTKPR